MFSSNLGTPRVVFSVLLKHDWYNEEAVSNCKHHYAWKMYK